MAEKTKLGQLIVQALAASPGMNDVDCATACIAGIEPNETWHAFLTRTRKILVADYGYEKVNPGSGGEPNQDAVVPPGLGVNGKLNADSSALAVLAGHGRQLGSRRDTDERAAPAGSRRREFEGRRSPPPATMSRAEVMLGINDPRGITEKRPPADRSRVRRRPVYVRIERDARRRRRRQAEDVGDPSPRHR